MPESYAIKDPSQIPLTRALYSTLQAAVVGEPLLYDKYAEQKPLLTALAKSSDYVVHGKLKVTLAQFLRRVELPEKGIPSRPQTRVNLNTQAGGPYKNQKIRWFQLGGWRCDCKDWYDLVLRTSEVLYYEHDQDFEACILPWIEGPQRGSYFSKARSEFTTKQRARPIADSGIYVATCLTANNCVALARKICSIMGYPGSPLVNPS